MYNHNVDMRTLDKKQIEALHGVVTGINDLFKSKGLDGFVEVVNEENGKVNLTFTSKELGIVTTLLGMDEDCK